MLEKEPVIILIMGLNLAEEARVLLVMNWFPTLEQIFQTAMVLHQATVLFQQVY